jgi:hypothetical protein
MRGNFFLGEMLTSQRPRLNYCFPKVFAISNKDIMASVNTEITYPSIIPSHTKVAHFSF